MHSKSSTLAKEMVELDMPLALERHSSFLEEDLALSSSTHDSTVDKTLISSEEKTDPDETTRPSSEADAEELQQQQHRQQQEEQLPPGPIYVSEDAMDCNYGESMPGPVLDVGALLPVDADAPTNAARHFELEEAASPELFESDADDEAESTNTTSTYQNTLEEARVASLPSPVKLSSAELILRADKFLLRRVNKYLSGVPPPPNHTISQKDCDDFLAYIKQNRRYFWADPFALDEDVVSQQQERNEDKSEDVNATANTVKCASNENPAVDTTVNASNENAAAEITVNASNGNGATDITVNASNENAAPDTTVYASNENAAVNATVNTSDENVAISTLVNASNDSAATDATVNTSNENATVTATMNTSNENTIATASSTNDIVNASSGTTESVNASSGTTETVNASSATENTNTNSTNKLFHQTKPGLRNLITAFDACEQSNSLKASINNNQSLPVDVDFSDTTCSFSISETLYNSSILSASSFMPLNEDSKMNESYDKEMLPTLYYSINVDEVAALPWADAFKHKCHEIYYNRNKAIEDFENLRMKLCDRYIGAETQSTCNAFFVKQIPGSARKRSLLAKRNSGQSPGKRLSYLARRRRTFSSANLQGLGLAEKRQLLLNVRKGISRKGKSPRGKSPRGKSPRGKTPRSSAKKRQLRRLLMEGPSPRKTKIETSKRALFQSPPADRPGPSRLPVASTIAASNNNPQKIKRALFPTPKKNEAGDSSQSQSNHLESRKRKSDEDLENPKQKWSKSLSFDCPRNVESSSSSSWSLSRHSVSNFSARDSSGRKELSETHRKKLLWAVAEALRGKGINVSHPQFKQYATTLARTVRKYMPDLDNKHVPRKPGSTCDRMLKLAKRNVILLLESKTAV